MLDCYSCLQNFPESNFYKETRTKRGYQRKCKSCHKAAAADSYEKNQDSVLARRKENYCPTADRDKKLKRSYGISLLQYKEMLSSQGGKCLICESTTPYHNSGQFVVDHCHSTGIIRGLLCHHCNLLLGHAKDSIVTLQAAINYLDNHG
jgi:hypothetical protein